MGILKRYQMEKAWEEEEEHAKEQKQLLYGEEAYKYTNTGCSGGCGGFLLPGEEGWGICINCRLQKDD
jgi:hypothetical protein